jgi:hypothetical protein
MFDIDCVSRSTTSSSAGPFPNAQRHVSLANIATAFLSQRKSSSRRSSARRKKRLTIQEKKPANCKRQSSHAAAAELTSASDGKKNGMATILKIDPGTANGTSKHHTALVRQVSCLS